MCLVIHLLNRSWCAVTSNTEQSLCGSLLWDLSWPWCKPLLCAKSLLTTLHTYPFLIPHSPCSLLLSLPLVMYKTKENIDLLLHKSYTIWSQNFKIILFPIMYFVLKIYSVPYVKFKYTQHPNSMDPLL